MADTTGTLILLAGGVLFLLIFAGLGMVILILSIRGRRKAKASLAWPGTTGEIVEARVERQTDEDSDGNTEIRFTPRVEYRYTVKGKELSSRTMAFGLTTSYSSASKAEEKIRPYSIGKTVTVYYNPEKPGEAVLERETGSATLGLVIGGIFLLVGFCGGGLWLVFVALSAFAG